MITYYAHTFCKNISVHVIVMKVHITILLLTLRNNCTNNDIIMLYIVKTIIVAYRMIQ